MVSEQPFLLVDDVGIEAQIGGDWGDRSESAQRSMELPSYLKMQFAEKSRSRSDISSSLRDYQLIKKMIALGP